MFLISLFNFILYFDSVIIPSKNYKQRKKLPHEEGDMQEIIEKTVYKD